MKQEHNKLVDEVFREDREKVKSQTLGMLVNILIQSCDYNIDYFPNTWKKIVNQRNYLVHHFGDSEWLNKLDTEEGCKACIAHLEAQREEAYSLYTNVRLFILLVLWLLKDNYANSNPNINLLYNKFKADIIDETGIEYINTNDPYDTVWENTRIVKLLRLAEHHTDTVDGMTSLSKAGQFIKKKAPECTPKRYGIKTLKGVLKASGLFELIESQDDKQNNVDILYKSKVF